MRRTGFTLAELLIALAILGVIATFTIPKVLNNSRSQEWNSIAKEAAAAMSNAYQQYQLDNRNPDPLVGEITPYLNYVNVDTTSDIDHYYGSPSLVRSCSDPLVLCLRLHSGAILRTSAATNSFFCGPANKARWFQIDPDGKVTDTIPSATGSGMAVSFYLYQNGRITNSSNGLNPTCGVVPPTDATPPWFSWD